MKFSKLLASALLGLASFSASYAETAAEAAEEDTLLQKRHEKCSKNACDPFEILQLINMVSPEKFNEVKDKNLSADELLKIADEEVAKHHNK